MDSNDHEEDASGGRERGDPLTDAQQERLEHYPERGYNLVEIDYVEMLGDALTIRANHLALSPITMPEATDLRDWVVYDKDGFAYTHQDLAEPLDLERPSEVLNDGLAAIKTDEPRDRRLGLLRLARLAESNSETCLSAVPYLSAELPESEVECQAEILNIFASIVEEYPNQIAPAVEDVIAHLAPDSEPAALHPAIRIVKEISDKNPGAVLDAVPKLAALLQDGSPVDSTAMLTVHHISKAYPDAVTPITPHLLDYVEAGDQKRRIEALSILGYLSKEYPQVAEGTIPTAIELLDADFYKLRGNAAGLLAELADEYPEQVKPAVSRVIELLEDDHEKNRYNATSILARIGKAYPEEVVEAEAPLINALDEEFPFSRSNACWALGYMETERALETLEVLAEEDPHEEVRQGAEWAVHNIKRGK